MLHGHGSIWHARNSSTEGRSRRRHEGATQRLGVTTALTGLLGLALVVTTTPPASAADPRSPREATAAQYRRAEPGPHARRPRSHADPPGAPPAGRPVGQRRARSRHRLRAARSALPRPLQRLRGTAASSDLVAALDAVGHPAPRGRRNVDGQARSPSPDEQERHGPGLRAALRRGRSSSTAPAPPRAARRSPAPSAVSSSSPSASDDSVTLDPASALSVAPGRAEPALSVPVPLRLHRRHRRRAPRRTTSRRTSPSSTPTAAAPSPATEWQTTPFAELAPVAVGGSADGRPHPRQRPRPRRLPTAP